MIILGIETSCDETAASIIKGDNEKVKVLSNVVSSQINIHKKYGGVIPEVAARAHVLTILPVIDEALNKAGIDRHTAQKKIDAIAVASGPGLITSLMVGVETAKTLSYTWNTPIVSINHIEGHIYANFIDNKKNNFNISKSLFPSVVLTVSGGHNMLVLMKKHGDFKTIGETRDDAAGEAFDKAAKLMGLGYPGGPIISKMASEFMEKETTIKLPRPMLNSKNYDFSFSGLKTALLYSIQKDKNWKKKIPEYCFEFQQAAIDVLIKKTIKSSEEFNANSIMLAGGVSANLQLRKQLEKAANIYFKKTKKSGKFLVPDFKYTTDNATMIATTGYFKALKKDFTPWQKIQANCRYTI